MAFKIYKAPEAFETVSARFKIFLAGSIDMGKAENWQEKITKILKNYDVDILNPRRDDWDSSWEQTVKNKQFFEQVDWEHKGLEHSDLIVMYFDKDGKAPITLLELGMFANSKKVIICCPDGYWRKGNVEYVAQHYKIPLFDNFDDFSKEIVKKLKGKEIETPKNESFLSQLI